MRAGVWLTALAVPLLVSCVVAPGNTPEPQASLTRTSVPPVGGSSFDYQFNENAPSVQRSTPARPAAGFLDSDDCSCRLHPHPAATPDSPTPLDTRGASSN
jgi:hypothetical protein